MWRTKWQHSRGYNFQESNVTISGGCQSQKNAGLCLCSQTAILKLAKPRQLRGTGNSILPLKLPMNLLVKLIRFSFVLTVRANGDVPVSLDRRSTPPIWSDVLKGSNVGYRRMICQNIDRMFRESFCDLPCGIILECGLFSTYHAY